MDVGKLRILHPSPEGFASILWKDSKKAKEAAEVMRLTAEDLKQMGVVERVIFEESDLTADRMGRVCERLSIYMGQFLVSIPI